MRQIEVGSMLINSGYPPTPTETEMAGKENEFLSLRSPSQT
jgi:hypothetical protein